MNEPNRAQNPANTESPRKLSPAELDVLAQQIAVEHMQQPVLRSHPPMLPFSFWVPMLCGALIGLMLRVLVFNDKSGSSDYSSMMFSFVLGAPIVCGALTVYLAERQARRSWVYHLFAPMGACTLMVLGALLVAIEGLICAVLIVPVFAIMAGISGLLMGVICRLTQRGGQTLGCVLVLPLLMAGVEQRLALPEAHGESSQSLWLAAKPEQLWPLLLNIDAISPSDSGNTIAWRIGVPRPLGAHTVLQDGQWVRKSQWHKDIRFDEVITELDAPRSLAWQYAFKPGDVPPGALDDHVQIGGRYFDLLDSRYTLTPEAGGTRLTLNTRWRVSTQWNWYALPLSRLLVDDLSRQLLAIYKTRSEQP